MLLLTDTTEWNSGYPTDFTILTILVYFTYHAQHLQSVTYSFYHICPHIDFNYNVQQSTNKYDTRPFERWLRTYVQHTVKIMSWKWNLFSREVFSGNHMCNYGVKIHYFGDSFQNTRMFPHLEEWQPAFSHKNFESNWEFMLTEISGSDNGKYEDNCLPGYCTMYSRRS
jgi:hypothetical protein